METATRETFYIHNTSRDPKKRDTRRLVTGPDRSRLNLHIGGGKLVVRRGRPLAVAGTVMAPFIPEMIRLEEKGLLEVFDTKSVKADLGALAKAYGVGQVAQTAPTPPPAPAAPPPPSVEEALPPAPTPEPEPEVEEPTLPPPPPPPPPVEESAPAVEPEPIVAEAEVMEEAVEEALEAAPAVTEEPAPESTPDTTRVSSKSSRKKSKNRR